MGAGSILNSSDSNKIAYREHVGFSQDLPADDIGLFPTTRTPKPGGDAWIASHKL
jgi:hypothetical protein